LFLSLNGGYLLYYPQAFDSPNRVIEMRCRQKSGCYEEADAVNFACNAVNIDSVVVMNKASDALKARLAAAGFQVIETLTEFLKAGGAAKCLTLRVTEPVRTESMPMCRWRVARSGWKVICSILA